MFTRLPANAPAAPAADGLLPFTEEGRKASREASRSKGYDGPEVRPNEERCLTSIGSADA